MINPTRVAITAPIILILRFFIAGFSQAPTVLPHSPASHPTTGKTTDIK